MVTCCILEEQGLTGHVVPGVNSAAESDERREKSDEKREEDPGTDREAARDHGAGCRFTLYCKLMGNCCGSATSGGIGGVGASAVGLGGVGATVAWSLRSRGHGEWGNWRSMGHGDRVPVEWGSRGYGGLVPVEWRSMGHGRVLSSGGKRRIAVKYEAEDTDKKLRWEPKSWREELENIRLMRSARDAPVDQMGAEKCFDQNAEPQVSPDGQQRWSRAHGGALHPYT
ncbi:unnamed protein product [Ranitomeya imitator]|uniref:MHC class I antigen n=1 Tax=Ranitomeya imitator TaxID=111125 RepID=A0ABN9KM58_9NEOB|nr:unnamed protein product [Ranitomeya imitator]